MFRWLYGIVFSVASMFRGYRVGGFGDEWERWYRVFPFARGDCGG